MQLVKIYAERASGTQIKKHTEFMKMIKESTRKDWSDLNKVDGPFGRNTLDTLKTLYELFILNIKV